MLQWIVDNHTALLAIAWPAVSAGLSWAWEKADKSTGRIGGIMLALEGAGFDKPKILAGLRQAIFGTPPASIQTLPPPPTPKPPPDVPIP